MLFNCGVGEDSWKSHGLQPSRLLHLWDFPGESIGVGCHCLLQMLSRLVITFLPRSKSLLISWLQSPSAVILEPQKTKSLTISIVSPSICHEVMGPDAMILVFWMLSFKPTFSLSSFTFIKRLFSSSLLSAIRVMSSAYLRLLIFLLEILIPACVSSSPAFLMMYSAYKLNKQGDNIQPWCTPFPIWSQSIVPCPVLTNCFLRFLKRQLRWSGIPISFRIFHSLWWSTQSNLRPTESKSQKVRVRLGICVLFHKLHSYLLGFQDWETAKRIFLKLEINLFTIECARLSPAGSLLYNLETF